MTVNVIRAFITALLLIASYLVIMKHYWNSKLNRMRHVLPNEVGSICNFTEFPQFLIEFLIMIGHFPPFLDAEIARLSIAFVVVSFFFLLKIVICLELLYHFSPLNTNKGRFIGSISKTQINTAFLMRAWLKSYPLYTLPSAIFIFLLCNTYVMYVVERDAQPAECYVIEREERNYNFKNCLWFAIISFLTVGYGDYFPSSYLGRAINTVIIMGGLVSSATIIGLIHQHMHLSNEEYHVFKFIKTRRKEQNRKKVAAKIVQLMLQMQVQRVRELNKANIKWRHTRRV